MTAALVIEHLRGAVIGPISLVVEAGTCAVVTGPSGAGKSLLLRMIADLDPSEGEVRLGDLRRASVPAPVWRRAAVYVPAEAGWWADTVGAHVPAGATDAARDLARRLGLPDGVLARQVRTLSTGERQRLALVRALVREPRCLLLDEPTSALDARSIASMEGALREAKSSGMTLLLVSHDAGQAARLGDRRFTMDAGRLAPA